MVAVGAHRRRGGSGMVWLGRGRRNGNAGAVTHHTPTLEALRAIDLRVRPDFRRTVVFGAIALIALVAGHDVGGVHAESLRVRLIAYGCALVTAVFGVAASRT